jgi:hypothetical protein
MVDRDDHAWAITQGYASFRILTSSGVSVTFAAARFSSRCAGEVVPVMGMHGNSRYISHASATCVGVHPFSTAKDRTSSSLRRFTAETRFPAASDPPAKYPRPVEAKGHIGRPLRL